MNDSELMTTVDQAATQLAWTALLEDSGADVAILSADGHVLQISSVLHWWTSTVAPAATIGRTLHDLYPKEFADERLELIRRVAATQRAVVLYGIWRGVRTRTVFRPLPTDPGQPARVLCTCRGYYQDDRERLPNNADQIEARNVDHGRLGVLTPRELEILSLIAQGMTTAAIAKQLFRSRKTIEAHRLSIGAKLGARNRVELARIALEAGLLSGQPGSTSHQTGRRYERARGQTLASELAE